MTKWNVSIMLLHGLLYCHNYMQSATQSLWVLVLYQHSHMAKQIKNVLHIGHPAAAYFVDHLKCCVSQASHYYVAIASYEKCCT